MVWTRKPISTLAFALLIFSTPEATPCTGIMFKAQDGSIIFGRSMEWGGTDLESELIIIPRGREYTGKTGTKLQGLNWTTRYGVVGMNSLDQDVVLDGINEKGLYSGLFYFPDIAEYPEIVEANAQNTITSWQLSTWILSNFATISEVRKALSKITLSSAGFPRFPSGPEGIPLHAIVVDSSGKSIVVEPIGGRLVISDNPLGILTNAPDFQWQMANIRNYVKLSPFNAKAKTVNGVELKPWGQGSGFVGLPGDITPPARFIRALYMGHAALPGKNGEEGLLQAVRVMNAFYITKGYVRESHKDEVLYEYSQWETFTDLSNRVLMFRTYDNPGQLRKVIVDEFDFDAKEIKKISIHQKLDVLDVTDHAK